MERGREGKEESVEGGRRVLREGGWREGGREEGVEGGWMERGREGGRVESGGREGGGVKGGWMEEWREGGWRVDEEWREGGWRVEGGREGGKVEGGREGGKAEGGREGGAEGWVLGCGERDATFSPLVVAYSTNHRYMVG
jgi:hypothetical protein